MTQERKEDVTEALMQAFHRFYRRNPKAKKDDARNEGRALVLLGERKGLGLMVSELSKLLHVTSPFATQLVNRFEERGWVVRCSDPQDGRIVRIMLTELGQQEADKVHQRIRSRYQAMVKYLGDEDARTFVRLLNKTIQFMELEKKCHDHYSEGGESS